MMPAPIARQGIFCQVPRLRMTSLWRALPCHAAIAFCESSTRPALCSPGCPIVISKPVALNWVSSAGFCHMHFACA
jgi:hypothetical protein